MQYYENSASVMNIKLIESLISNLMKQHLQLRMPEPMPADERPTRIPITLNYFTQKKRFCIMTKRAIIPVSKRQLECLQCLIEGMTTKEAARLLCLSTRTVDAYIEIIRNKLDCKNRIQLVRMLLD
jgi:DNA-binding CsgD family transcriptional regulator